jgi:hypothetical protein
MYGELAIRRVLTIFSAEQSSHSPYIIGYPLPVDCSRAIVVGACKGTAYG